MKNKFTRFLSMFLCLVMALGVFIVTVESDGHNHAHAADGCIKYNNTAGCRTHYWCSWGCAAHEYDTYKHTYSQATGKCTSCGASNGHTHKYTETTASSHPHAVTAKCSCGYSYTNGYKTVSSCTTCNPPPAVCTKYNNTSGCRTHYWCSWGCSAHEYDTYNHTYSQATGKCSSCGASNGHTHSYSSTTASAHPHAVTMKCSTCSYSYTNGYANVASCTTCNPNCKHGNVPSACPNCNHIFYSNSAGCRTHHWCSWGCHDSDTYNHTYNAAGKCTSCGASNGHTHSYTRTVQTAHPHNVTMSCSCGYSYANGTTLGASCSQCTGCVGGHSLETVSCTPGNNYSHNISKRCTKCGAVVLGNSACVLVDVVRTYKGNSTHGTTSRCTDCNTTYNQSYACAFGAELYTSNGDDTHTALKSCTVCAGTVNSSESCDGAENVCAKCGGTFGSVVSSVSLRVVGPMDDLTDSGVLSVEADKDGVPLEGASFSVYASVSGDDKLTNLSVRGEFRQYATEGTTLTVPLTETADLCVYTISATTKNGAIRTITISVKSQGTSAANIRYRTIGMHIESIQGASFAKSTDFNIDLIDASIIPEYEYAKIASIINRFDGATYSLKGSLIVEVYRKSDGYVYGRFDTKHQFDALWKVVAWGDATKSSFYSMQNATVTYQAPVAINATARYVLQLLDGSNVTAMTRTAQDAGVPAYIFPYETTSLRFSAGAYSPPSNFEYHGLQWEYSPQKVGYTNGSQVGLITKSEIVSSTSPTITYTFYWKEQPAPEPIPEPTPEPTPTPDSGGSEPSSPPVTDPPPTTPPTNPSTNPPTEPTTPPTTPPTNPPVNPPTQYPDLLITDITPTRYHAGQDVITAVKVAASGKDFIPSANVQVRFQISSGVDQTVSGVVISNGGTNLVVFRWTAPTAIGSYTMTATIDPNDYVTESNESNNVLSKTITIEKRSYAMPEEADKTYPSVPSRTSTDTVTWTEQRYEGGRIVTKTFWAKLDVSATIDYKTKPLGYMRSGYGFFIDVTPTIITNYDKPELLTGAQTSEAYLPHYVSGYNTAIPLVTSGVRANKSGVVYHFSPNPVSLYNYAKQYVPVWWRDEYSYAIQVKATDAYTPAGTLTAWRSGGDDLTITIEGSMYDDVYTTIDG